MAQTRNRASGRRSSTRRRSPNSQKSQSRSQGASASQSSNGESRVRAIRRTVESSTKGASQSVGKAASKAKTPLLAGSAALAAAAGGMAIGTMRSRQSHSRKVLGVKVPKPKRVKIKSRDVATAAKELGTFGQHVGELASELRHAREASGDGNKQHRSPLEVVLQGLTARR